MHHQAHREGLGLGVDEAAPADPLGAAQELLGGALPADQAEAVVDLLLGQRVESPDPERHLLRLEALVQPGLLGQERERPVAGDHQRSLDDVVDSRHPHSPHGSRRASAGPPPGSR